MFNTRFERVLFDVILLKKRKKSFFGGKLLGELDQFLLLFGGISAGFFMPVSVASSDRVTASPGSIPTERWDGPLRASLLGRCRGSGAYRNFAAIAYA